MTREPEKQREPIPSADYKTAAALIFGNLIADDFEVALI